MENVVAEVVTQDDSVLDVGSDDDVNMPEDEMLTVGHGLFFDPTAECEDDDFQDTVPTYEDTGKFGIRGKSSLLPMDVGGLLKSRRVGVEMQAQQTEKNARRPQGSSVSFR